MEPTPEDVQEDKRPKEAPVLLHMGPHVLERIGESLTLRCGVCLKTLRPIVNLATRLRPRQAEK
eukprot:703005-Amphidinium_carterae.1